MHAQKLTRASQLRGWRVPCWRFSCAWPMFACVATLSLFLLNAAPVRGHSVHRQPDNPSLLDGLIRDPLLCGDDFRIEGTEFCTHGPDFGISEGTQVAARPITCDGDGVSGKRVQVLYVRELLSPDHYEANLDRLRMLATDVNRIIDDSAHATGGHRHIRFVTTPDCQIDVKHVVIPPVVDFTFSTLILSLKVLGYTDPDRKYLMFVESNVYCGIGTTIGDTRPGPENRNNHQAGYARVDKGCWTGTAAAHELIHTLGGVQKDSPNSSGGWHCTDEWDLMCYSDPPSYPAMRYLCPNIHESLLDCNHDDYFHTNPPPGSYLAEHWNMADSAFLLVHNLPPTVTLETVSGAHTFERPATITLVATASDPDGAVRQVEFLNGSLSLGVDATPPYSITWPAPESGTYTITARALDDQGASAASPPLALAVVDPPPPPRTVDLYTLDRSQVYTAPTTVVFSAQLGQGDDVSRVEFYQGESLVGEDATPPYTFAQSFAFGGVYTFTARAYDSNGAGIASQPFRISLAGPPPPPEEELSPPTVSARFGPPGVITITAQLATSGVEIDRVAFYHRLTLLGSDTTPPYRFVWAVAGSGVYTFTARVYDNRGHNATSAPYVLEVAPEPPPPDPPPEPEGPSANPVYLPIIVRPR